MLNIFGTYTHYRVPNSTPPNFTPQKNQGQKVQGGPGPVIVGPNQQGPGPVIVGPGNPNAPGQGWNPQNPGIGGGLPWQPGGGPNNPWQNIANKIRPCQGRFTYIWLNNGSEFWFYIRTVTPRYIYGWRMRRGRWEYGRIALNRIDMYYCNTRESE